MALLRTHCGRLHHDTHSANEKIHSRQKTKDRHAAAKQKTRRQPEARLSGFRSSNDNDNDTYTSTTITTKEPVFNNTLIEVTATMADNTQMQTEGDDTKGQPGEEYEEIREQVGVEVKCTCMALLASSFHDITIL